MKEKLIPAWTLAELVDQYMMLAFNDRRKYYLNYLAAARWVWNDLLKETIWMVKSKYVEVDKTTTPYSVVIPRDIIRLLNVSVVDSSNRLQPFSIENEMSTLPKPKIKMKCSCHGSDGCDDSLCDAIDSVTVIMKDVMIGDAAYTEKTWTKRTAAGELWEIREVPVKNYTGPDTYTVIMDTQQKLICALDVNAAGCIPATPANIDKVIRFCGACLPACMDVKTFSDLPQIDNEFGSMKIEGNRVFLNTKADWVIISGQTNGDCPAEEILVPSAAGAAMLSGINYRTKAFRPGLSMAEREEAKRLYGDDVHNLDSFLRPIRLEAFMKIGWTFPKWGHSYKNETLGKRIVP